MLLGLVLSAVWTTFSPEHQLPAIERAYQWYLRVRRSFRASSPA